MTPKGTPEARKNSLRILYQQARTRDDIKRADAIAKETEILPVDTPWVLEHREHAVRRVKAKVNHERRRQTKDV